ncbi:NAD-dependent epimerase/dehydratase family protein [Plebeiibacterium marinum]|uniref:NAD-dependent epimerase/dehydratase family protein n=1 Tax=Plebeiibacterium marinum TaxID=2992111 RepID=A0AAE3MHG8_9BACT|nr:NAD-dependent epimerase/dehydratase family protein [Plebeiobacterium marinum]MCW3807747.1 NAD-dependent epimerase/dehydratase family protein [Plebeiobacterium marinum]
MKVYIIGGTGLLGSASSSELIKRGHRVRSVALPPVPENSGIPKEMELVFGNYMTMNDDEIREQMTGCDALVFAAGVDERVEFPAPVLDAYIKFNVTPVERLLRIGKETGIKRAVIMGSYFAHFAKKWPHMKLTEKHPYIKSRILQEEAALAFNGDGMDVMILELPYIFGTQPGRKPVWTFLVEAIRKMKGFTFYTKGGTTMVTVNQVAQAVAGALENGNGGTCYPVGWYNMTWKEMLAIFHKYMGLSDRKVITIPSFLYRMAGKKIMKDFKAKNIDSGLDMVAFTKIQTSRTFIDRSLIEKELGVLEDDVDVAIGSSVELCLDALDGTQKLIEMKAE